MFEMELPNHFLEDLIAEATADEVGLWFIISTLRDHYGIGDVSQRRLLTLKLVQELLSSGQVIAGYYNPDGSGITPWKLSSADILTKINSEWDTLGRDPTIGEIVIFFGLPDST